MGWFTVAVPLPSQPAGLREGSWGKLRAAVYRKGGLASHLGSTLTSLSHLASRRVRSAVDPYFLKSYLMSLISLSLGACGGVAAFLFEGTW